MTGFGSGFTFGQTGYSNGLVTTQTVNIPTESLVLNYDISDTNSYAGSGNTVVDLKGNSNATLYNTPTYASGYLSFDPASSEYLITNTSLAAKVTSDVTTIAMWAYPMDNGVLLSERGEASLLSGWHDSQMEMVSGAMEFGMWSGSGIISFISSIATPINNWYHFAMTYNGTKLDAYVNGNNAGSATFSRLNPIEGGAGIFYAVAGPDTTNMGDGTYAKMRLGGMQIYNIALSAEQITKIFNDKRNQYGI